MWWLGRRAEGGGVGVYCMLGGLVGKGVECGGLGIKSLVRSVNGDGELVVVYFGLVWLVGLVFVDVCVVMFVGGGKVR